MTAQHTPGPWLILSGEDSATDVVITTELRTQQKMSEICGIDVYYEGDFGKEQNANARLIYTAPDLIDGLQAMVDMWRSVSLAYGWEPEHKHEFVKALAIIAKATGQ